MLVVWTRVRKLVWLLLWWGWWPGSGSWVRCGREVKIRPVEGERRRSASGVGG